MSIVQTSRWFACPSPSPRAKLRLFCFPYGGGGATIYHSWARYLPETIEVVAIQPPGRENRIGEAPYRRVAPMIEDMAVEILPLLDKPFVFFGHSMGALLAYELAACLRRQHGPSKLPLHLYASSHFAPQIPRTSRTFEMSDADFQEQVRFLNGTPREVLASRELMELVLPTLRADFELCETYEWKPQPPLECTITAYAGLQEGEYTQEFRAWSEQTSAGFQMRMFPGDHFYLNSARELLLGMLGYELQKMCR